MQKIKELRSKHASILRYVRKIHRILGISLFVFFIAIGLSGVLLGWKKNSSGKILPHTRTGVSTEMNDFASIDIIAAAAEKALADHGIQDPKVDRMDVRPGNGIVKVTFKNNYYGVQVDAKTAEVLQIQQRYSDLIEQLHDGSYVDDIIGWKEGYFKLFYTTTLGIALIAFSVTGFWLWYGPKYMRKFR